MTPKLRSIFLTLTLAFAAACTTPQTQLTPTVAQPITQPQPTAQPTTKPLMCGASQPVQMVVLIGKDLESHNREGYDPADYRVGFADAVRLARVDFTDGSVTMLPIPRDLLVQIPGLAEQQIYANRLKNAYAYGYQFNTPGGGPGLVRASLQESFNLHTDNSVAINFTAFTNLVDTLGGIDLQIEQPVGSYPAGLTHFDGAQALAYAQLRDEAGPDNSDASRVKRQTQVLLALRDKVLQPATLKVLPTLVQDFYQLVVTDLSLVQINQLLCLANNLGPVQVQELPASYFDYSLDDQGHEFLTPHTADLTQALQRFAESGAVNVP